MAIFAGFGQTALSAVEVGDDAPDFELMDTDDNLFRLESQRGNIVLLFFLGFSCSTCKTEAPYLENNIYLPFRDRGVQVVGVEIWGGTETLIEAYFIGYTGITFSAVHKSGFFKIVWDGRDKNAKMVSSGVYLYTLKAGNTRVTKRMLFIR